MPNLPTEDQPVVELDPEECWELFAGAELGRLAYHLVDEVHIVPLNYVVDGESIVFLTTAGNKLLAAEMNAEVAFQIDWYGEDSAWSALARGHLRHLDEVAEDRLAELDLHPWVPTLKYDAIQLVPEKLSGRRFLLRRPGAD